MTRAALLLAVLLSTSATAAPLAALAPADDARKAVPLGPAGEVYAPDGAGGFVRTQAITTADAVSVVGRAGGAVVVLGDGVVYRLADNGWTALRLVQKGKAVMSGGARAVAAVGRQLFALDKTVGGEPLKLALAPADVLAIGAGARGVVIATAGGVLRMDGKGWKKVPRVARVDRLLSDRWAIVDRGIVNLATGAVTAWPPGVRVTGAVAVAGDAVVAVGSTRDGLELVTLGAKTKPAREPIAGTSGAKPVGVVVDKAGRAVIALADGRVARRERNTWTVAEVREALPAGKPGSPPATLP